MKKEHRLELLKKSNEYLIEKAKETKEKIYLDIIFEKNKNMIYSVINNKSYFNFPQEDLLSVCYCTLMKCIENFDISKKTKFSTYLYTSLKRKIVEYISRELDYDYFATNYIDMRLMRPCQKDTDDNIDINTILYDKNILDDIEIKILEYKFGLNGNKPLTRKEICSKIKICGKSIHPNTLDNYIKKALNKIRKYKKENYNEY